MMLAPPHRERVTALAVSRPIFTTTEAFANAVVLACPVVLCCFDEEPALHLVECLGYAIWVSDRVWVKLSLSWPRLVLASRRTERHGEQRRWFTCLGRPSAGYGSRRLMAKSCGSSPRRASYQRRRRARQSSATLHLMARASGNGHAAATQITGANGRRGVALRLRRYRALCDTAAALSPAPVSSRCSHCAPGSSTIVSCTGQAPSRRSTFRLRSALSTRTTSAACASSGHSSYHSWITASCQAGRVATWLDGRWRVVAQQAGATEQTSIRSREDNQMRTSNKQW